MIHLGRRLLNNLKFAVFPVPCTACLIIGFSLSPNVTELKSPDPNIAELGILSKV